MDKWRAGCAGAGAGFWGGGVLLRQHRLLSSDAPSDLGVRTGSLGAGSCKASKRGGGVGARGISGAEWKGAGAVVVGVCNDGIWERSAAT